MLLSVFWLTPRKGGTKIVNDVVWAVSIPFCWYLFFVVIIPWLNGYDQILGHAILILFVLSSVAFLFFLTRIVFIFLSRKPDYQNEEPARVNRNGIRRTISQIEQNTARTDFILPVFSQQTPLLSAWYRFIVTDNLSLSSDKVMLIERVILGKEADEPTARQITEVVRLEGITVESAYDADEKAWRSWVHLTLHNAGVPLAEYLTEFELPEGCYISNYYLDVNGERKHGLLADKRAAEWIYRQITTIKRDPGLLRYVGNDRLELRVFPFVKRTRKNRPFMLFDKY
jgi:hypothetical protein